jgi:DNA-binding MarR family transcriptional regulator
MLDSEITMKQGKMLEIISQYEAGTIKITELSELIGSSRQNAKKMALLLSNQGYLSLTRDEKDARILRVALTEKGIRYCSSHRNTDKRFLNNVFDGFEDKQLKGLIKSFDKLSKNVARMEKNATPKEPEV